MDSYVNRIFWQVPLRGSFLFADDTERERERMKCDGTRNFVVTPCCLIDHFACINSWQIQSKCSKRWSNAINRSKPKFHSELSQKQCQSLLEDIIEGVGARHPPCRIILIGWKYRTPEILQLTSRCDLLKTAMQSRDHSRFKYYKLSDWKSEFSELKRQSISS